MTASNPYPDNARPGTTGDIHVDDRRWSAWSHLRAATKVGPRSFGVKDVIDVAGMPTSCGYLPMESQEANVDAPIVKRLRDRGWDPIGKTETAQFAFSDPAPSRSPYHDAWTPGGSSSGSAVAVARRHVRMALGTQTGGSIVRPAAYCGVVGVKPTHGRLPIDGIHPLAPSIDTAGFLSEDVTTAWEVAAALGLGTPSPNLRQTEAAQVRLLDVPPYEFADESTKSAWVTVARTLSKALDVDSAAFGVDLSEVAPLHRQLLALEAAVIHGPRLTDQGEDGYGPNILELVHLGESLRAQGERAEAVLVELRTRLQPLEASIPEDGVLMMPATIAQPPLRATSTGSSRLASPWTVVGVPVVTVPWVLHTDGPTARATIGGVQLIAAHGNDEVALAVAATVEHVLLQAGLYPTSTDDDRNST